MMEQADVEVCSFYLENRCRFGDRCRNYHPPQPPVTAVQSESSEGIRVVQKSLEIPHATEPGNLRKKMRTAVDVLNRILWDEALNAEDFHVVYLDRFAGLISVPLLQFHGDGNCDDAISENVPQHRVQQILYNNDRIIWEKQSRTDFVFGSTGYPGTITDFIKSLESEEQKTQDITVTTEEKLVVQP